jgi:hypothetical protein
MSENHVYSEVEWQLLHAEIQQRLGSAAEEIQAVSPSLQVISGKTMTKLFPLFSFVRFKSAKGSGIEDMLMGVEIVPDGTHWRIDANVCAEESGEIYFELPVAPFAAASFEQLKIGVLRTVEQLAIGAKPVLLGLFSSTEPVLPGAAASLNGITRKSNV